MNRTWPEAVVCDEVLPLGGADRADPRRVPETSVCEMEIIVYP